MSWSTIATVNFRFKKDVKNKKRIIELLAESLEVCASEIKFSDTFNEYYCKSLNFNSHVEGKNIAKIAKRFKNKFETFFCTIYYLDEAPQDYIQIYEGQFKEDLI